MAKRAVFLVMSAALLALLAYVAVGAVFGNDGRVPAWARRAE